MSRWPTYVFILLCLLFLAFSFMIYSSGNTTHAEEATMAREGRMVWQRHNCQSCHQLFGLGGYLGPDLSNIYSQKGEAHIRTFLKMGTQLMPVFDMAEEEVQSMVMFLKNVDECGTADPRRFKIHRNGMISPDEKAE